MVTTEYYILKKAGIQQVEANDTYSDARYFKHFGAISDKERKCLKCDTKFLSKDGVRTCKDCREDNNKYHTAAEAHNARNGR